jgi:type II secretory pathway component PulC
MSPLDVNKLVSILVQDVITILLRFTKCHKGSSLKTSNFDFRPGDIITHVNGVTITSSKDIYKFLEDDCNLSVTVMRKGKIIKFDVDLEG